MTSVITKEIGSVYTCMTPVITKEIGSVSTCRTSVITKEIGSVFFSYYWCHTCTY
jgi:hypothetical protein